MMILHIVLYVSIVNTYFYNCKKYEIKIEKKISLIFDCSIKFIMRIHYMQHIEIENLGIIESWAKRRHHYLSKSLLYKKEFYPKMEMFDFLIVMGGPMNIYEHDKYPFLVKEKEFIKKAIENNKIVLGICLGAQLIADVLGNKVYKGQHKEIGWFPVILSEEAKKSPILNGFPDTILPLHWHGDTFDIPENAMKIGESKACKNQGFIAKNNRVVALQFHLEPTEDNIANFLKNFGEELVESEFIQNAQEIEFKEKYIKQANDLIIKLLNNIEKSSKNH
jgi:GMP synthase-like glutamine amidotransferase